MNYKTKGIKSGHTAKQLTEYNHKQPKSTISIVNANEFFVNKINKIQPLKLIQNITHKKTRNINNNGKLEVNAKSQLKSFGNKLLTTNDKSKINTHSNHQNHQINYNLDFMPILFTQQQDKSPNLIAIKNKEIALFFLKKLKSVNSGKSTELVSHIINNTNTNGKAVNHKKKDNFNLTEEFIKPINPYFLKKINKREGLIKVFPSISKGIKNINNKNIILRKPFQLNNSKIKSNYIETNIFNNSKLQQKLPEKIKNGKLNITFEKATNCLNQQRIFRTDISSTKSIDLE